MAPASAAAAAARAARNRTSTARRKLREVHAEAQGWLCFWCEEVMTPALMPQREPMPETMCTFEHLDPRTSPYRGLIRGYVRSAAACFKCNTGRSKGPAMAAIIEAKAIAAGRYIPADVLVDRDPACLITEAERVPNDVWAARRRMWRVAGDPRVRSPFEILKGAVE